MNIVTTIISCVYVHTPYTHVHEVFFHMGWYYAVGTRRKPADRQIITIVVIYLGDYQRTHARLRVVGGQEGRFFPAITE